MRQRQIINRPAGSAPNRLLQTCGLPFSRLPDIWHPLGNRHTIAPQFATGHLRDAGVRRRNLANEGQLLLVTKPVQPVKPWRQASSPPYAAATGHLRPVTTATTPSLTTPDSVHSGDAITMTVLDSLQQHVTLLDAQGNIVRVNQAWKAFALANGGSAGLADAVGMNYVEHCRGKAVQPCGDGDAAAAGIEAVLAGRLPSFELEYPCHGPGGLRWFLLRAVPFRGPGGGAVILHENITPRLRSDAQRAGLIDELLEFKAALDTHALVSITDATGRITYVNDKFCAVAKWSREELIGRDHRIINSGHHPKPFLADLWSTIGAGGVWRGELKNRAKDGSIYWVDTTIVPLLGANGGPNHYIAMRTEITQRKLLEEQHAQMVAELLAANRELSEFAYVVSHDLKAPLRGISSLASWLVSDYSDRLGEDGRAHLNLIASRVKRLSGLIDAILTYSRAGRSGDERLPVALEPLVRNTIDLLAPPAHIAITIDGRLPDVSIDAVKIQQVFQNLLSNAIDFMDKPDGRVTVACLHQADGWHFSVTDNGPGIPAKHFERIFQLFQTLASRDERERTGVGLALVKKIVELEGGRVWVESVLGQGAAFHFTLPDQAVKALA